MEQLSCLDQFKKEIEKLLYENIDTLNKVAILNNFKYQSVIRQLHFDIIAEAESKKLEEDYLLEIRKQWQLHLFFLNYVRIVYDSLGYKKLLPLINFYALNSPAFRELKLSVTPSDNPIIQMDEHQMIYWQYLEFAIILEGAMVSIDYYLSTKLGYYTNFENIENPDDGTYSIGCRYGDEFMVHPVIKLNAQQIRNKNEAEATVRRHLDDAYYGAIKEDYEWLIMSILKYPFPDVLIPEVNKERPNFAIQNYCTKDALYHKIKCIKKEIYPRRSGKSHLILIFVESTKNLPKAKRLTEYKLNKDI